MIVTIMRTCRRAAVCLLLAATAGLYAQTDATDAGALDVWEAPVPSTVRDRPRPDDTTIGRILSLDWLPWLGEPSGARFYQNLEDSSVNLRDRARAALGRAEWYRDHEEPYESFLAYKHAVSQYANYIPFADVMKQEYLIASDDLDGKKERYWIFWLSTDDKALEVYEHIFTAGPFGAYADDATYRAGMIDVRRHRPEAAVQRFRQLAVRYPGSDLLGPAKIEMARAMLAISDSSDHDLSLARDARAELEEFVKVHPDDPAATDARQLLDDVRRAQAEHLLFLGEFYQRHAHYRAAASRRYLNQILTEYADTPAAGPAADLLAKLDGAAAPNAAKIDYPGSDTYLIEPPAVNPAREVAQ